MFWGGGPYLVYFYLFQWDYYARFLIPCTSQFAVNNSCITSRFVMGSPHVGCSQSHSPYLLLTTTSDLVDCSFKIIHKCSIIYTCQDLEASQVSISRWVDKATMGHLHDGILLGHKKEKQFTICDGVERPGEHYVKWNELLKERQMSNDITHV